MICVYYVPHLLSLWILCATPLVTMDIMCHTSCHYGYYVPHLLSLWILCATPLITMDIMCHTSYHYGYYVPHLLSLWILCATLLITMDIMFITLLVAAKLGRGLLHVQSFPTSQWTSRCVLSEAGGGMDITELFSAPSPHHVTR